MFFEEKCEAMNDVSLRAHDTALKHGFYDDYLEVSEVLGKADLPECVEYVKRDVVLAQLAKIASEVGECVEVVQKSREYDGLAEELADIVIRTMDLAAFMDFKLGTAVAKKMAKNETRSYKHGKLC